MHMIVLVLMVLFTHAVGDNKPPEGHLLQAPTGTTMEQCRAKGQALVNGLRQVDGVASAEFTCVDLNMAAAT